MYSPSDGQLAQYISWLLLNEHGPIIAMPISSARYRAMALYSSGVMSLVSGIRILALGASGICEWVV